MPQHRPLSHATRPRFSPSASLACSCPRPLAALPVLSAACHPRSSLDRHFFLRSQSRLVRRTPKPSAQDQHRPITSADIKIARHRCSTSRVAHRPWPPFLEVWTSSLFRRIAAVYGIAQVDSYAFDILFCFGRSALHSLAFPIRPRPCFELVASFLIPRRLRDRRRARGRHSINFLGFGLHIRRRATCRRLHPFRVRSFILPFAAYFLA